MTPKLLVPIFTLILFLLPVNTYAAQYNNICPSHSDFPDTITAYLESDTGEIYEVTGHLANKRSISPCNAISESDSSATYEFILYSSQDYTLSTNGTDGSISVRAYLTIEYRTMSNGASTEYLLTKVSGSWSILDPRTSVTSAYLNYGCTGFSSSNVAVTQDNHCYVNNNFSINTGYTKYVIDSGYADVGCNLKLNLQIATTRIWSFTLYNNIL